MLSDSLGRGGNANEQKQKSLLFESETIQNGPKWLNHFIAILKSALLSSNESPETDTARNYSNKSI